MSGVARVSPLLGDSAKGTPGGGLGTPAVLGGGWEPTSCGVPPLLGVCPAWGLGWVGDTGGGRARGQRSSGPPRGRCQGHRERGSGQPRAPSHGRGARGGSRDPQRGGRGRAWDPQTPPKIIPPLFRGEQFEEGVPPGSVPTRGRVRCGIFGGVQGGGPGCRGGVTSGCQPWEGVPGRLWGCPAWF